MAYVDQGDLEEVTDAATIARLFDADGDGVADPHVVAAACDRASAFFDTCIMQGWPDPAARRKLIDDDPDLRGHVAWVAIYYRAKGKAEWRDQNGVGMYRTDYLDAKDAFDRLAKGKARSKGEARAGENPNTRGRVNHPRHPFVFASSRRDPKGPGGF